MKCQRVDWIYNVDTAFHSAVTFERVFPLLTLLAGIEEFDGYAALDTAACISLPVGHASNGTGLVLQGRLAALPGFCHVTNIVKVDAAGGHGHDEGMVDGRCAEDLMGLVVL